MPPSPTRRRHSSARRLFQKQQDDLFARANSLAVLCMLDNPDNEPEDHEMTLGLLNAALSYVRQANEPRTEPTTEEIRANRQPPFVWDNAEAWLKVQHEADVIGDFRFQKEGLLKLRQNLNLPEQVRTKDGCVHDGLFALLVLLRRLSHAGPTRLLCREFGLARKRLNDLFNTMIDLVFEAHGHLLTDITMFRPHFERYAAAIHSRGSPLKSCVGFVDGNCFNIAKPKRWERSTFNGSKRRHCLKFQGVTLANGLFGEFMGPYAGTMHDSTMMGRSRLLRRLRECCGWPGAPDHYCLYGDPAYRRSNHLARPYKAKSEMFAVGNVRRDQTPKGIEISCGQTLPGRRLFDELSHLLAWFERESILWMSKP